MRTPLLAGNWKMNGSRLSVESLLSNLKNKDLNPSMEMVVFPSFPYLPQTAEMLSDTAIAWGAQDVCVEDNGAFTGEVSAAMLVDFGCRFVIVGHSERRLYYGESDLLAAQKCEKALTSGLTPILCVGETEAEKTNGLTEQVIGRQLSKVLERVGVEAFNSIVLAYEPVWAIGTGLTASPEEAEAAHAFLRHQIAQENAIVAKKLRILYGGSLKANSASALFVMANIDGGLVGGASLDAEEFLKIAEILTAIKINL